MESARHLAVKFGNLDKQRGFRISFYTDFIKTLPKRHHFVEVSKMVQTGCKEKRQPLSPNGNRPRDCPVESSNLVRRPNLGAKLAIYSCSSKNLTYFIILYK